MDKELRIQGRGILKTYLLCCRHHLESLHLDIQQWRDPVPDCFLSDLAEGVRSLSDLRSFGLHLSENRYEDEGLQDLAPLIRSLGMADHQERFRVSLTNLTLEFGFITKASWSALSDLVKHPGSILESLRAKDHIYKAPWCEAEGLENSPAEFCKAVKDSATLKCLDLDLHAVTDISYIPVLLASNLSQLFVCFDVVSMGTEDRHIGQWKARMIQTLQSNTRLERLKVDSESEFFVAINETKEFRVALDSYCKRNKDVSKAATAFHNTPLPAAALSRVLASHNQN